MGSHAREGHVREGKGREGRETGVKAGGGDGRVVAGGFGPMGSQNSLERGWAA